MTLQFSNMTLSDFLTLFCFFCRVWLLVQDPCEYRDLVPEFYKGLTRNPEIGNTPLWVLPNICRLGRVKITKFGMNLSHKMLLNAAKCQGYSFCHF